MTEENYVDLALTVAGFYLTLKAVSMFLL